MDIAEVLDEFRHQVDDNAQPELWSDEEAMRYLAFAQDHLVRTMGGIADATTSAIVDLTLTASTPYTAHSPYILRIRSGRLIGARRDIVIGNEADVVQIMQRDYGWSQGLSFDDTDTGNVDYGVLGVQENQVRWFKVPDASDTCRLHVQRLPYPRLTDEDGPTLEVSVVHHLKLVDGMKWQAYLKQDAETYDPKKSAACEAAFRSYCDEARKQREKQQYRPRVVQYGGL